MSTIFQTSTFFISQNVAPMLSSKSELLDALTKGKISPKNRYSFYYFGNNRNESVDNLDWTIVHDDEECQWIDIKHKGLDRSPVGKCYPVLKNGNYVPFTSGLWSHEDNQETINILVDHVLSAHFPKYEEQVFLDSIDGLIDLILLDLGKVNIESLILEPQRANYEALFNCNHPIIQKNLSRVATCAMLTLGTKFQFMPIDLLVRLYGLDNLADAFIKDFVKNRKFLTVAVTSGFNRCDQQNVLDYINNHDVLSIRMKIMLQNPEDAQKEFINILSQS